MSKTVPARAQSIADFLLGTVAPAMSARDNVVDKSKELQDASAEATNQREALMANIAAAADANVWTVSEVESACQIAGKKLNNDAQRKSFGTMVSEIKLAANEKVRARFADVVRLRNVAWAEEEMAAAAAKKAEIECERPCKLAFARAYHMLTGMLRAVIDTPADHPFPFNTTADVVSFAQARDPRRDPAKVAKQIESLVNNLRAFHALFPVQSIGDMVEYAQSITADTLTAEMKALADAQAQAEAAKRAAEDELLGGEESDDTTTVVENDESASTTPNEPAPAPYVDPVDALLELAA